MALSDFLVGQARAMESGVDHAGRAAKESVPSDRIKDAPAVARELRWRVRLALEAPVDREGSSWKVNGHGNGAEATKRKRKPSDGVEACGNALQFRNFRPKAWDAEKRESGKGEKKVVQVKREEVSMGEVVQDANALAAEGGGVEGGYESRSEVIVRARQVAVDGRLVIERQEVSRVTEMWTRLQ